MNVSPVFASPLVLRVFTTSSTGVFSWNCTLKTVENTVTPHSRLWAGPTHCGRGTGGQHT